MTVLLTSNTLHQLFSNNCLLVKSILEHGHVPFLRTPKSALRSRRLRPHTPNARISTLLRMRIGRDFTTIGTIVYAYLSTISLLHVLHIASTGGCYLLRCSVLLYLCAFLPIDRLISGRCISIARIYP